MALSARSFQSGDLERMIVLTRAAWRAHGPHVENTPGDLSWRCARLSDEALSQRVRLWEDGGELVAFASRSPNAEIDMLVHPRPRSVEVVPRILRWADTFAGEAVAPTAWALAGNEALTSALHHSGLTPSSRHYIHFRATLDTEISVPSLPIGYRFTSVMEQRDVPKRAAVHRAAFGTARLSDELYRAVMDAPGYDPRLDVAVVAPDDELAAFSLGWFDSEIRVGELEPVGTHPAHRRRGLALAAVRECMRRLRTAGATSCIVYSAGEDERTLALYAAAGFAPFDRNVGHVPMGHRTVA